MNRVSVLCATYNQEAYISQAIKSLLMQKTSFEYEILIHDDASTDATSSILKEYARNYPERIKLFIETENKFQKNIDFWHECLSGYRLSKYIAYCEGDDFWTDPYKLQKQYEALEEHPEIDMCACRASMVSEDGSIEVGEIRPRKTNGLLTMEETILGGGMFLATNSLFYRREMAEQPMRFEQIRSLDYATQMRGALRGGIYYIDDKMAAYRRFAQGSWTSVLARQSEAAKLQCEQEKEILCTLDEETNGKYHETIVQRLKAYDVSFFSQLVEHREDLIEQINDHPGKRFMWGCGMRGMAFEQFCNEEGIRLDGVCDITNINCGQKTAYGNIICCTEDVLKEADVILASATRAYDGLQNIDFNGYIINLQKYMPIA